MAWLTNFLTKYGVAGGAILVALAMVYVVIKLVDLSPFLAGADPTAKTPTATAEQMNKHIEQAKQQTETLRDIKGQLEKNHQTQAMGLRILCVTQAKTDQARTECAKIE